MGSAYSVRDVPDAMLVDVGNTCTKFAFAIGSKLFRLGSVRSVAPDVTLGAKAALAATLPRDAGDEFDCAVTSVRPQLNGIVRDAFSGRAKDFFFLNFDRLCELPVVTIVDYIAADRVADVAAVTEGECPAIVIDFGTATTMDVIDTDHVHLGGSIMPGIVLNDNFCATAPPVKRKQSILDANVAASRHAAAVYGHAGAVDHLCEKFAAEVGPARIVATGGLAQHVVPHCRADITIDDDLTLRGTRRAHVWWRTGSGPIACSRHRGWQSADRYTAQVICSEATI